MDTQNTDQSAVDAELAKLQKEAEEILRDIETTNTDSKADMDALEKEIDVSIVSINQSCDELDAIEEQTSNELDTHMLQQAEDLASE